MAAIALPTQTTTQASGNMLADSGRRIFAGSINLPASYNTGGYTIAASQFGMVAIETIISGPFISGGKALVLNPVIANDVLTGFTVFSLTDGTEVAGTTDCSAAPCFVLIVGN